MDLEISWLDKTSSWRLFVVYGYLLIKVDRNQHTVFLLFDLDIVDKFSHVLVSQRILLPSWIGMSILL